MTSRTRVGQRLDCPWYVSPSLAIRSLYLSLCHSHYWNVQRCTMHIFLSLCNYKAGLCMALACHWYPSMGYVRIKFNRSSRTRHESAFFFSTPCYLHNFCTIFYVHMCIRTVFSHLVPVPCVVCLVAVCIS